MATTVTNQKNGQIGNRVAITATLTAGSSDTAITFATGLANVDFAVFVPTTDEAHDIYLNYSDAGSTAAAGTIYINNVGNSDAGNIFVIGA